MEDIFMSNLYHHFERNRLKFVERDTLEGFDILIDCID